MKTAIVAMLLATAIASPVNAADAAARAEGRTIIEHARLFPYGSLPPVEFDHPFDGTVSVITKDMKELREVFCSSYPHPDTDGSVLGCARLRDIGWCTIFIVPDDVLLAHRQTRELVLRHEIGHCNGWPANHPGAWARQ